MLNRNPKFESALGFLLGDMLGSPFEGSSAELAAGGYRKYIGSYTDDTIMYLAVLKARHESVPLAETLLEYFDIRRGFGARMAGMLSLGQCVPGDSWGNGAATRTAALALFDDAGLDDAAVFSEATHTHPESIACSKAVFLAVRAALKHQKNLKKSWQQLGQKRPLGQYSYSLKAAESIPPALIIFEQAGSFEDALQKAVSLGGDTDSIGAVTGALAGAYYGIPNEFVKLLSREDQMVSMLRHYLPS